MINKKIKRISPVIFANDSSGLKKKSFNWQKLSGIIIALFILFSLVLCIEILKVKKETLSYILEKEQESKEIERTLSMEKIIKDIWEDDAELGIAIAKCESGLNPQAKNKNSTASGLFQILEVHWYEGFNPFNPYQSACLAYQIYKRDGTKPWESTQSCWNK